MANFSSLKQAIETYIKQNGNKEITGALLQSILLSMVTTIGDGAVNDLESDVSDINSDIVDINGALTASVQFTGGSLVFKNANDTVLYSIAVSTFLDGIVARLDSGAVYAGYAAPSTTPDTLAGQKVFYVATQAGTYIHFLYNGDTPITLAKDGIYFIVSGAGADDWNAEPIQQLDDVPTPNSNNPIKSGAVLRSIIQDGSAFDLSAHNAVGGVLATYADLSEALTALNSLDDVYKQPGMSFRFVQSNDNKYVQYRLMADSWSINTNDWSFCGNDVLVENPEWIYVLIDANKRILAGIKSDGSVEWSIGIPTPVKAYIDNAIAEIKNGTEETNLDGLNKIIDFLSDFSTSDTLKNLLDTKVDKEEGKSLVDSEYAEGLRSVENPEFIDVLLSKDGKVLETVDTTGKKIIYGDCEIKGALEAEVPHKMQVILDMDYGGDCDDAYALRLVGYYHSIGKIDVKMISSCYKNTPRVMGMLAQADYDGLGGIPVVAGDYEIQAEPIDNYGANAVQIFPHERTAPDGVGISAFRKYLSQIKGKCIICTTGHLYNISDLINSQPDEWSPLNGNQLINEKVESFVVMGGRYDSNSYQQEFNFCDRAGSKEATINFFANVSVPIYLCGFELCLDTYIGKDWDVNLNASDKFRGLEQRFVQIWGTEITTVGRLAADPLTVMFLCNDLGKNIGMTTTRGYVSLDSNAGTKFTPHANGTHYLVSGIYDPSDYEWRMNTLLWRKSW